MIHAPLTDEERRCARRKFVRHLWFMQHIEVYWVPSIRGIITRTVDSHRRFRLPAGAISFGRYAYCSPDGVKPGAGRNQTSPPDTLADQFLQRLDEYLAAESTRAPAAQFATG